MENFIDLVILYFFFLLLGLPVYCIYDTPFLEISNFFKDYSINVIDIYKTSQLNIEQLKFSNRSAILHSILLGLLDNFQLTTSRLVNIYILLCNISLYSWDMYLFKFARHRLNIYPTIQKESPLKFSGINNLHLVALMLPVSLIAFGIRIEYYCTDQTLVML